MKTYSLFRCAPTFRYQTGPPILGKWSYPHVFTVLSERGNPNLEPHLLFTFSHLADALIQSDLQLVQGHSPEASRVKCPRTQRHLARPGIDPTTFWLIARLPNRSAIWPPYMCSAEGEALLITTSSVLPRKVKFIWGAVRVGVIWPLSRRGLCLNDLLRWQRCKKAFPNGNMQTSRSTDANSHLLEKHGLSELPVILMLMEVTANAGQKPHTTLT